MKVDLIFTTPEAARFYGGFGPQYATAGSCAFDLRACIENTLTILPSEQVMVPTGIRLDLSKLRDNLPDFVRYAAIALPRSGRGSKEGLCLGNTVGLCDEDYQGEIMLCVWARPTSGHINPINHRIGGNPIHIEPGERIAQLAIVPMLQVGFKVVDQFGAETERGEGGFGSTGVGAVA
jgi:dUTP pyrophosphatase